MHYGWDRKTKRNQECNEAELKLKLSLIKPECNDEVEWSVMNQTEWIVVPIETKIEVCPRLEWMKLNSELDGNEIQN